MYVITIIGATQQGKTPFIKNYMDGSNCLINDFQDEYGQRTKYNNQKPYGLTEDNTKPRSRYIKGDIDEFIQIASTKKNTIVVFEDATLFFQGITDRSMRRLIFSKAFSKNVYVLVFHSINSVPPRIMEGTNYVVLFKTNDEIATIERKYPRLLKPFLELQNSKDGSFKKIRTL